MVEYTHPHPNPAHVMRCYRGYILKAKRQFGGARSLIHHRRLLDECLAAKRLVLGKSRDERAAGEAVRIDSATGESSV